MQTYSTPELHKSLYPMRLSTFVTEIHRHFHYWRTIIKSFAIRPNTRHRTSREDVTGSSTGKKLTKNTDPLLLYGPGPDYFTREHSIRCAKVLLHVVGTDQTRHEPSWPSPHYVHVGIMWDHEKTNKRNRHVNWDTGTCKCVVRDWVLLLWLSCICGAKGHAWVGGGGQGRVILMISSFNKITILREGLVIATALCNANQDAPQESRGLCGLPPPGRHSECDHNLLMDFHFCRFFLFFLFAERMWRNVLVIYISANHEERKIR